MYDVVITYNDGTTDIVVCENINHAPDGMLLLIDVDNEETNKKAGSNVIMIPVRLIQQVTVFEK